MRFSARSARLPSIDFLAAFASALTLAASLPPPLTGMPSSESRDERVSPEPSGKSTPGTPGDGGSGALWRRARSHAERSRSSSACSRYSLERPLCCLSVNSAQCGVTGPSVQTVLRKWQYPAGASSRSSLYQRSVPDCSTKKRRLLPEKAPDFLERKPDISRGTCGATEPRLMGSFVERRVLRSAVSANVSSSSSSSTHDATSLCSKSSYSVVLTSFGSRDQRACRPIECAIPSRFIRSSRCFSRPALKASAFSFSAFS
mmetsp:Transcript_74920/g.199277  ORF Transcript_74920/g.199277 Transcript_74920/m.199277 type:complete len:259 (-) Transcript_74920:85-861(-)